MYEQNDFIVPSRYKPLEIIGIFIIVILRNRLLRVSCRGFRFKNKYKSSYKKSSECKR